MNTETINDVVIVVAEPKKAKKHHAKKGEGTYVCCRDSCFGVGPKEVVHVPKYCGRVTEPRACDTCVRIRLDDLRKRLQEALFTNALCVDKDGEPVMTPTWYWNVVSAKEAQRQKNNMSNNRIWFASTPVRNGVAVIANEMRYLAYDAQLLPVRTKELYETIAGWGLASQDSDEILSYCEALKKLKPKRNPTGEKWEWHEAKGSKSDLDAATRDVVTAVRFRDGSKSILSIDNPDAYYEAISNAGIEYSGQEEKFVEKYGQIGDGIGSFNDDFGI